MKTFNYWCLSLVVILSLGCYSCAQNKVTIDLKEDEKLIEFTIDRFTLPNLHVTPDGENIIFDVLGDIYQVPIEGGKAEVILQDNNWKRAGKLSPDGRILAYVSDERGESQVWTYNLENKEKKVYPIKEFTQYPLYAYWRNNGDLIIPSKEGLQVFDVNTGKGEVLRTAKTDEKSMMHTVNREMIVNCNGTFAFYQKNGALWKYDLDKKADLLIGEVPDKALNNMQNISSGAEFILYYKINSNNINKNDLLIWNIKANETKCLFTSNSLGLSTSLNFSFDFVDESNIILDKEGEIVRMNIETGDYQSIPIEVQVKKIIKKPLRKEAKYIKDSTITASVLRNPVTQPNLDTIYFGAFGKLHSYAKNTEQITEVYSIENRFEVSPSLSPDGEYLAYTTWNDSEMGHLYIRELETGKEYQLTKNPGRYINPAWSPDGTEIIFVRDETETKMGITKQTAGSISSNYNLSILKIELNHSQDIGFTSGKLDLIYRLVPSTNLPRRFYPIPVYHSSGKSIFISTRNKEKNLPFLLEVDLVSKEIIQQKVIPFHTDEVVISPDRQHIAFIYDEQVWVDTFPYNIKLDFSPFSNFVDKRYHYKGGYVNNILLPKAKSVFEVAPSYLSWQNEHILMWGSTEEVYTYDVRSGKTEKMADIKVQKTRAIPKAPYALTNARIITMNKKGVIIEKGTILVNSNRIEAVGDSDKIEIPKNYKIFDFERKTIIPGLIDVHTHYHHAPYEFQGQQNYQYIGNLAYGVTSIYDPSVNVLDYRERAQMVEVGITLGPRVFGSGNPIQEEFRDPNFKNINNKKDSDRLVSSLIKLKVHGPIKEYSINNRLKRKLLSDSTREENIRITAHQDLYKNAISRIIQGYYALEHEIGSFPIQNDFAFLLSMAKVYYSPTYTIRPGIKLIYDSITNNNSNKLLRFNGKVVYNNRYGFRTKNNDLSKSNLVKLYDSTLVSEHPRAIRNLILSSDAGVKFTIGGHSEPLPGISTHWELWFMTKGMSGYQALQAATINGAEKLDLQEEIGSIEKGKLADMVVLNTSPLESIYNTTDILYTIQNGNIYEAETMKQIHPVEKELQPWGWDSPTIIHSMEDIFLR